MISSLRVGLRRRSLFLDDARRYTFHLQLLHQGALSIERRVYQSDAVQGDPGCRDRWYVLGLLKLIRRVGNLNRIQIPSTAFRQETCYST